MGPFTEDAKKPLLRNVHTGHGLHLASYSVSNWHALLSRKPPYIVMSMCLRGMHMDSFTFVAFKVITAVPAEIYALLECEAVL